mmetsp:Transcript_48920/g.98431  ORF Transcript_48920/g.98431 Transcript_48920/m.98431 type:complete len:111 (-) Transcript_48920:254-586(-)
MQQEAPLLGIDQHETSSINMKPHNRFHALFNKELLRAKGNVRIWRVLIHGCIEFASNDLGNISCDGQTIITKFTLGVCKLRAVVEVSTTGSATIIEISASVSSAFLDIRV